MQLTELCPAWIHENIFVFLCPHCKKVILSCKNKVMSFSEQWEIFTDKFGDEQNRFTVHCEDKCVWNFPSWSSFETLTVIPSIDASKSGHWHGFITNGQVS